MVYTRGPELPLRCATFAVIVCLSLGCDHRSNSRGGVQPSSAYVESLHAKLGAKLTLEPRLQNAAETALRAVGKPGAIVAFEPDSGTVRALFSVRGERGALVL